ncbi:MAG TPA: homogentisate 1,2-dioxygenase [Streptosporangiaceae bacterium]|nr:homogentisate 1,2-dioxygenase [Streptosporangiaceae bacterium]
MPFYRAVGEIPRKRHVQMRRPDGGLYAEELMGEEGFSADSSLLYHINLPTAMVKSEGVHDDPAAGRAVPNLPLAPRHFRTQDLPAGGDLVLGRQLLLGNDDVRIYYSAADAPSDLYRNSAGDEMVYLQAGEMRFESVYGSIDAGPGDYVLVPAGTIHRWIPAAPARALVVEARGHIQTPRRYLSPHGQFLEHAPYSERDLRGPAGPLLATGEDVPVLVRNRAGLTRLTYAHHPFDVVGWDGYLYPHAFNIADFEPLVKRTHAPPPVHQTFEGPNFVVCSFCPRPLDFDAAAVPIPYNHHNVDSDEMMFYVGGDYSARRGSGIGIGSISLHPSGCTHGPQPGAVEAAVRGLAEGRTSTDETAVMIDTFRPLLIGPAARQAEDPGYAWSWAGGRSG